jgi:hypothetical protein
VPILLPSHPSLSMGADHNGTLRTFQHWNFHLLVHFWGSQPLTLEDGTSLKTLSSWKLYYFGKRKHVSKFILKEEHLRMVTTSPGQPLLGIMNCMKIKFL